MIQPSNKKLIVKTAYRLPISRLADDLAEDMICYAGDNWQHYVDEDGIYIDIERELERTYERMRGVDLPDYLYEPLLATEAVRRAEDVMRDIIREQAENAEGEYKYYNGTMAEKMAERGLSYRDFV